MKFNSLLSFLQEADRLKNVERKTLIYEGNRHENSAEHSWHLALAVLSFHSLNPKPDFDLPKALKMAILHDLVEIDAGDVFIYGDQSGKAEKEQAAAERLFGLLPEETSREFRGLWQEFENKESPEARFVAGLDRFLPLYSNLLNRGYTWRENGITHAQVVAKNQEPICGLSPELWEFVERKLEEAVQAGELKKD
jgi:putative hydrolases of HD superfamily